MRSLKLLSWLWSLFLVGLVFADESALDVDFVAAANDPKLKSAIEQIREQFAKMTFEGPGGYPLCESVIRRKTEETAAILRAVLEQTNPQFAKAFEQLEFRKKEVAEAAVAEGSITALHPKTIIYRYREVANQNVTPPETGVPVEGTLAAGEGKPRGDYVLSTVQHLFSDERYRNIVCWDEVTKVVTVASGKDVPQVSRTVYTFIDDEKGNEEQASFLSAGSAPKYYCAKGDNAWEVKACQGRDAGKRLYCQSDARGECLFNSLFPSETAFSSSDRFVSIRTKWTGSYFISGLGKDGKPSPVKLLVHQ